MHISTIYFAIEATIFKAELFISNDTKKNLIIARAKTAAAVAVSRCECAVAAHSTQHDGQVCENSHNVSKCITHKKNVQDIYF